MYHHMKFRAAPEVVISECEPCHVLVEQSANEIFWLLRCSCAHRFMHLYSPPNLEVFWLTCHLCCFDVRV